MKNISRKRKNTSACCKKGKRQKRFAAAYAGRTGRRAGQNGEVLSPEAFDELPEDEKKSLIDDLNMMQEEIENAAQDLPEWEDKQRRESSLLREKFIKVAVKTRLTICATNTKGTNRSATF